MKNRNGPSTGKRRFDNHKPKKEERPALDVPSPFLQRFNHAAL